jgi:hypothetical protein
MNSPSESQLARAEDLRSYGFVHITGINLRDSAFHFRAVQSEIEQLGHWSERRGEIIIVTPDGEVWLGFAVNMDTGARLKFCPEGEGEFDFHTEGEGFLFTDYFARKENPYVECHKAA